MLLPVTQLTEETAFFLLLVPRVCGTESFEASERGALVLVVSWKEFGKHCCLRSLNMNSYAVCRSFLCSKWVILRLSSFRGVMW
jgi:hypothetical protein